VTLDVYLLNRKAVKCFDNCIYYVVIHKAYEHKIECPLHESKEREKGSNNEKIPLFLGTQPTHMV
jgi:hypothetical protein